MIASRVLSVARGEGIGRGYYVGGCDARLDEERGCWCRGSRRSIGILAQLGSIWLSQLLSSVEIESNPGQLRLDGQLLRVGVWSELCISLDDRVCWRFGCLKPRFRGDPRGRDRSRQRQSIQQRAKGADFANCASGLRVSLLLWEKIAFSVASDGRLAACQSWRVGKSNH
ncbi:hypothetical protein BGZ61DRAFT_30558 [Ilyonectria robusta]|uniref:uncharacterized protein n=1 Tax=Ilyonectria robusta TaxID=1079257 RepID=UPI001E8DDD70|nr:uncharacterized protein BGZ61DRAFT_30558 [Ilyonectria robusta]KAH8738330.1 hypothetical protein BGZ61DRAFT_30558 [Ilyonectria robusta]